MNTRSLSTIESANLAAMNQFGVTSVLLFVTSTGIEKSILDATEPIRQFLRSNFIHSYDEQAKGTGNKVFLPATIVNDTGEYKTKVSLYRPETKNGDPRMWFYGLKDDARPDDVYALFVFSGVLHAVNLTRVNLASNSQLSTLILAFFQKVEASSNRIANELLGKLRDIARQGPISAIGHGDTTIGMSIESALGIQPNSSRTPDYHGIELKATRKKIRQQTRTTLFACVPDWGLSPFNSSKEILDRFGYNRDGAFRLYCSVSTLRPNSQGLQFVFNDTKTMLKEISTFGQSFDVAVWSMSRLERSLAEKHKETFWITARSTILNGLEQFQLLSVVHTRNPNIPQFSRLLETGDISMDHLIKRTSTGGASERGPLFKIDKSRITELFLGEPQQYQLI